ncbi:MAG: MFS transporter [Geminicoccaceae bacterium]|nr:MFS transporter [Geminicoccaceae bacterium]
MSAALDRLQAIPRTLGHRNFRAYIAGNSVSLVGTWMQRIGVGWLAWELTGSATVLGLVAFADLFPAVVIGPLGGALADRGDRRRMMFVAQSLNMAQALVLFVLTASGLITIELLVALVLFSGIVIGFNQPARLALVPSLVPRADLGTAVAINAIVFNGARFIGPALAGLLIVQVGIASVFLGNALSFLAFLFALTRLELPAPPVGRKGVSTVLAEIGDGIRYAARHPGIGPLLLLHLVLALGVRPFVELLPGFASEVFEGGAGVLAVLSSTIGIGAIAGGLWLAQLRPPITGVVLAAAVALSLVVLAFALAPAYPLAVALVGLAGAGMLIAGAGAQTVVQTAVEEGMRGRVMSLYGLILRGGPALGALAMGAAADLVGLRIPLALGTLAALIAAFWLWQRRQRIGAALEAQPR